MNPVVERKSKSAASSKKSGGGFVEKTLKTLVRNTERALFAEELAQAGGFLQKLDPRVKIVGLLALILAATTARNFFAILFIFAVAVLLAVFSRVPIKILAIRAWLSALFFTGLIAFPVLFITPGDALLRLPFLNLTITAQGLTSALYLILRVETTVTLSILLVLCTLWTHVLKALRVLRVPVVFVVILGMTYRYIFVMLETARNMFEARQSRLVGALDGKESRKVAAASVGVLLMKSFYLNSEVYLAMQSRGFRGEIRTLDEFRMRQKDWLALVSFLSVAALAFWLGRFDSLIAFLNVNF
ncbi:MAG TPA: cobalt ECF transporter T component CbiQ [Pyrinomonadaceae bacterium]|nr:cobalt ECF transporter T component CbiQ [Pyrinomonadaceae bacterium]